MGTQGNSRAQPAPGGPTALAAASTILAVAATASAVGWAAQVSARTVAPGASSRPLASATATHATAATPPPLYAPYVAQGDILVPATVTPTPTPAPTPIQGFDVHCQPNRDLEYCTWLSEGEPARGSRITAFARLFDKGHPVAGVTMEVRWSFPYPAGVRRCDADTGPDGVAACAADVPPYSCRLCSAQIMMTYRGWPNQRLIRFQVP